MICLINKDLYNMISDKESVVVKGVIPSTGTSTPGVPEKEVIIM